MGEKKFKHISNTGFVFAIYKEVQQFNNKIKTQLKTQYKIWTFHRRRYVNCQEADIHHKPQYY